MKCHNLLYICFNRSDLVIKTLSRLLELQWDNIIFYIDGSRNQIEDNEVDLVRKMVFDLTSKANSNIEIFHRETNYGCRRNIENALSYFFKKYNQGWVFEDDILLKDVEIFDSLRNSWSKTGHLALFNPVKINENQPFRTNNGFYLIWGWYLDSKNDININMKFSIKHFVKIIQKRGVLLGLRFCYTYFQTLTNKLDTWDSLYTNWCIQKNIDSYICPESFVENIGFDQRATHTRIDGISLTNDVFSKNDWEREFTKFIRNVIRL